MQVTPLNLRAMKILLINNFHYRRGGSEAVYFNMADMLDEELIEQLKPELPEGIECMFISSVAGLGIQQLKDKLWQILQE